MSKLTTSLIRETMTTSMKKQQGTNKIKKQILEVFTPQKTRFRRERILPLYKDET